MGVDPVILASARKHGITDEEMLHAYRNPIRVFEFDELSDADRRRSGRADARGWLGDLGRRRIHRPRHDGPSEIREVMFMPRSMQDILDHADELAKQFEDYDPSPDDEVGVAEHLLRRAALARRP